MQWFPARRWQDIGEGGWLASGEGADARPSPGTRAWPVLWTHVPDTRGGWGCLPGPVPLTAPGPWHQEAVFGRTRISRSEGWSVQAWTLRSSLLLLLVDPEPGALPMP